MARNFKISIVAPAYEEQEALPFFHEELLRVVNGLGKEYEVEILYVDDGSRDGTLSLLQSWAGSDPRVRYLSFSRNFGHQAAVTAGLEHARGAAVITLDSDLQHPPELIPVMLDKWRLGFDVVATVRGEDPNLSWFKRNSSRAFYKVMGLLSDTEVRPAAADFRLMSRRVVRELLRLRESHRFLRGLVQWLGFRTAEIHFQPAPRAGGRSKFTLRRLVAFACDALVSFSRLPLRLPLALGAVAVVAGLVQGVGAVVRSLLAPAAGDGLTLFLLSSLYLMGGALLCGLGVVGEYVGRIYEEVKGRPLYVLKETEADSRGGVLEPAATDDQQRSASAA
jgi:dolichol-phosphate mannosyltransferase